MTQRLLVAYAASLIALGPAVAQPVPHGPDLRVNTYTPGAQESAAVAASGSGSFLVVWDTEGEDGDATGIAARRFDASGAPAGPGFVVNAAGAGDQHFPRAAMDGTGRFAVVWQDFGADGSGWGIFGRRFDGSGAPVGGDFQVNTTTADFQIRPAVAMDASGAFVVVWEGFNAGLGVYELHAQRYDAAGAPAGPEFQPSALVGGLQRSPAVGMDGAGSFLVVWEGGDGSGAGIVGRRFDEHGTPLGPNFVLNAYTSGNQLRPAVAVSPSGDFVVVWKGYGAPTGLSGVSGRRFDAAGAPLGDEFQVAFLTTSSLSEPSVAMDPMGGFVILWDKPAHPSTGFSEEIFGQHYDDAGAPQGGVFTVNGDGPGTQSAAAVAKGPTGRFLAAWTDYPPGDGSLSGVEARLFDPPPCLPLPAESGGLLVVAVNGGADLHFTWANQPDADDFLLFEDADAWGAFASARGSAASGAAGLTVPAPPGTTYYLVAGRNACGVGPRRPPPDPNIPEA
jgi:hypothetical protein